MASSLSQASPSNLQGEPCRAEENIQSQVDKGKHSAPWKIRSQQVIMQCTNDEESDLLECFPFSPLQIVMAEQNLQSWSQV